MRKSRSLVAALLAALACMAAVGVADADAAEYAHHVGIASGANYFGPYVTLYAAETIGYGSGLGCAGIRGISGVVCETEAGSKATIVLSEYVASEPYIHNHATFTSYFNGYYY
ncbi:MAG TPA: hypothetical protein VHB97_10845 [Polyangia bacterium]|nr:hypothetical protein [Polyangia bacterium]